MPEIDHGYFSAQSAISSESAAGRFYLHRMCQTKQPPKLEILKILEGFISESLRDLFWWPRELAVLQLLSLRQVSSISNSCYQLVSACLLITSRPFYHADNKLQVSSRFVLDATIMTHSIRDLAFRQLGSYSDNRLAPNYHQSYSKRIRLLLRTSR